VAWRHGDFSPSPVVFNLRSRRRRPRPELLDVFFSDPESPQATLKLPRLAHLEPDHHRAVTPSQCLAPIRRTPASCPGEPRRQMCPKMEPHVPPLRSGTKMPKKDDLELCSGESPPSRCACAPCARVLGRALRLRSVRARTGPRAALGRAGRLLAAPGPSLAWPGARAGPCAQWAEPACCQQEAQAGVWIWKMIIFLL